MEVKWGKEKFAVEVDLEQPPAVLKTQLFSLTGVPPERQKIMGVKGGLLKDDGEWAKLGLKAGQKLTMMGTADKVPEAPTTQQTFMEDLPEEEQDTSGELAAAGRPGPRPPARSGHARCGAARGGGCREAVGGRVAAAHRAHRRLCLQAWASTARGCRTWGTLAT